MSKLADTLRKEGWRLTPCDKLKPGDYIAVITVGFSINEGLISRIAEYDNRHISVFYGDNEFEVFRIKSDDVWLAPKEYEHLEVRWDGNGAKFINISADPRRPIFCLASYITFKHVFNPDSRDAALSSCENPETLLKEKPIKVEAHDPRANNTPQEQSNNAKE